MGLEYSDPQEISGHVEISIIYYIFLEKYLIKNIMSQKDPSKFWDMDTFDIPTWWIPIRYARQGLLVETAV